MKTQRNYCLFLLSLFAALGFLFGCSGNPVITAEKKNKGDDGLDPGLRHYVVSGGLAKDIEISGVKQAQVSGDLLKVQFNLRNRARKAIRVLYKIEWFDANGIMINDSSQLFQSQLIRANEPVALQSVATNPLAKNFRIKIQAAKAN